MSDTEPQSYDRQWVCNLSISQMTARIGEPLTFRAHLSHPDFERLSDTEKLEIYQHLQFTSANSGLQQLLDHAEKHRSVAGAEVTIPTPDIHWADCEIHASIERNARGRLVLLRHKCRL